MIKHRRGTKVGGKLVVIAKSFILSCVKLLSVPCWGDGTPHVLQTREGRVCMNAHNVKTLMEWEVW